MYYSKHNVQDHQVHLRQCLHLPGALQEPLVGGERAVDRDEVMGEFMEANFARFVRPKAKFSYNDAKKADKV